MTQLMFDGLGRLHFGTIVTVLSVQICIQRRCKPWVSWIISLVSGFRGLPASPVVFSAATLSMQRLQMIVQV